MQDAPRVGVIDLGLLGTALAERLLDAGFQVFVYNRTRSKADSLIQRGACWSDNPLAECDRVVISLYTTEIVELFLEDLQSGLRPGHFLLDTTTGEPSQTETLGTCLYHRGVEYLKTPIAASSEQTRRGEAVAIVGGTSEAFQTGRDLLNVVAAKSFHVGGWGAAAKLTLVNNLILGLHRVALAKAWHSHGQSASSRQTHSTSSSRGVPTRKQWIRKERKWSSVISAHRRNFPNTLKTSG